jgi:hypothetical protein
VTKTKDSKGAISPQKLFTARIKRLEQSRAMQPQLEPNLTTEDNVKILRRLCSDERMQIAWKRLVEIPEDAFEGVLEELLSCRKWCVEGRSREQADHYAKSAQEIHAAREKICDLLLFCDQKILPGLPTVAEALPDLPGQLKDVVEFLRWCENRERREAHILKRDLSRKFLGGRAEFTRVVADSVKWMFGKPHYEIVATLVNVIFNTTDDDGDISADAVRKIVNRTRSDDSPN